jgi:hypothetical protein
MLPPPPPREPNVWAALQNLGALTVTYLLADHHVITGNVAAGMVLGIVGVIVYPALLRGGHGRMGSIGVLTFAKPLLALLLGMRS